jgi:hypothetical protein
MKDNLTAVLAIWGAVVSTLTAGWSIFRDFVQRDRLVVSAQIMWLHPGNEDIFNWSFKNTGNRELTITHLAAMPHRRWRPLWLFKRINGRRNSQQWLFPFDFINGHLPLSVGPLKGAAAAYRLHPLGVTEIGELFAVTADGREWFADRSSVRNILASKTFQTAIAATKQQENQQVAS